jgi:hypothetical protein
MIIISTTTIFFGNLWIKLFKYYITFYLWDIIFAISFFTFLILQRYHLNYLIRFAGLKFTHHVCGGVKS